MTNGLFFEVTRRRARPILAATFGALLVLLIFLITRQAIHQAPSFDGAMNFQVANSIATGQGYRRNYADRVVFPHEIETGPPLTLPAAFVFRSLGVGITQAQAVNIAYFLLLLLSTYFLVRQRGGREIALFAACTVATIPGMLTFGFNGYGEIPALSFIFAAAVIYFSSSRRPRLAAALTGVLLALGVIAKTVMLIGAGAVSLCIILELISSNATDRPMRLKRFAAMIAGGLFTVSAMETWRATALGGLTAWHKWWRDETGNIFQQAGLGGGHKIASSGFFDKLAIHLEYLGHYYQLGAIVTAVLLGVLCLAFLSIVFRVPKRPLDWGTLAILLAGVVYMAWWIMLTPTAKAWHRRILDGMICADVGLLMFAAGWLDRRTANWTKLPQMIGILVTSLAVALPLAWLVKMTRQLVHFVPADNSVLLNVAAEAKRLPEGAYVFAVGWNSAPRVGLFSGRTVLDFNDFPVQRLDPHQPIYFVRTPTPGGLLSVLANYGLADSTSKPFALIPATSLTLKPLTADTQVVRRRISAAENYGYMRGFNGSEGANGRWLSDDNIILLRPKAGDHLELVVYTLPISAYRYKETPKVVATFNGCATQPQPTVPGRLSTLKFAIPDTCNIVPDQDVNVRIEVDNVLDSPITRDDRALAVLGKRIGFVGPNP